MDGIVIKYKGDYEKEEVKYSEGDTTHLLYKENNFEAIIDVIPKGVVGYEHTIHLTSFEFNYILKGELELKDGKETIVLRAGDSYSYHFLKKIVMMRVIEAVEILSINTTPCFDDNEEVHHRLLDVLEQLQKVDGDTMQHCLRVTRLCMGIAYYLDFDPAGLPELFEAASFHDVGKAKISKEILLKPGRLSSDEYEIMKKHSLYTYEMIKDCYGEKIASIAFEHHEKLDGSGYPRKLKGNQICLSARIICVADAYDAMIVTRPYRQGLSKEEALKELYRCSDTQFDRDVVIALEKYIANN